MKIDEKVQGKKVGFCPNDEHITQWNNIHQERRSHWSDNRWSEDPTFGDTACESPASPLMGLSPGWGEYYEWQRVEQFVEFPTNADNSPVDGYYLLRTGVDVPENFLLESNKDDNWSYAFFKVTGGVIQMLNSGYGNGPCGELIGVASRKQHEDAGSFDIDLPIAGTPGVECRSGGPNDDYTMVFRFANTLIDVNRVTVKAGTGTITSSTIGSDAHEYIVNLTGVTNAQVVAVGLTNVSDSAGNFGTNVSGSIALLQGDTSADISVNSADISQTKSQSGRAVSSSNFREDVTTDGSINSADISLVKSKSGKALSP